jgi:hypothetical protein
MNLREVCDTLTESAEEKSQARAVSFSARADGKDVDSGLECHLTEGNESLARHCRKLDREIFVNSRKVMRKMGKNITNTSFL